MNEQLNESPQDLLVAPFTEDQNNDNPLDEGDATADGSVPMAVADSTPVAQTPSGENLLQSEQKPNEASAEAESKTEALLSEIA